MRPDCVPLAAAPVLRSPACLPACHPATRPRCCPAPISTDHPLGSYLAARLRLCLSLDHPAMPLPAGILTAERPPPAYPDRRPCPADPLTAWPQLHRPRARDRPTVATTHSTPAHRGRAALRRPVRTPTSKNVLQNLAAEPRPRGPREGLCSCLSRHRLCPSRESRMYFLREEARHLSRLASRGRLSRGSRPRPRASRSRVDSRVDGDAPAPGAAHRNAARHDG